MWPFKKKPKSKPQPELPQRPEVPFPVVGYSSLYKKYYTIWGDRAVFIVPAIEAGMAVAADVYSVENTIDAIESPVDHDTIVRFAANNMVVDNESKWLRVVAKRYIEQEILGYD